jgi:hypothetical protein
MSRLSSTAEKYEEEEICKLSLSEESTDNNIISEIGASTPTENLSDNTYALEEKFDKLLVEAIDEAITSLGEPVKNTFYYRLENDLNIPKNEIPQKLEEFAHIIHRIFGIGASRLEIMFMKNLNSKVKAKVQMPEYEWPVSKWIVMEMSFVDYVNNLRKDYELKH